MFIKAIQSVAKFTRSIHSISRTYQGKNIMPGSSTLFFVNDEGYAVTCKHVIELLVQSDLLNKNFENFKAERQNIPRDGKYKNAVRGLEIKYKIQANSIIQLKNSFVDCVDSMSGFTWHLHPDYDLAILKFNDFQQLHCNEFAVFKKDSTAIFQGKFLCRLGFPFPEFNNFTFNEQTDDIDWIQTGVMTSPTFPIEGMITRFLGDEKGAVYGIELSVPGLKGQSGAPLFDSEGIVYGMQSRTKSLHLGFDIENKETMINGEVKKISSYSFIHLGECIHVNVIKDFLKQHQVKFSEA